MYTNLFRVFDGNICFKLKKVIFRQFMGQQSALASKSLYLVDIIYTKYVNWSILAQQVFSKTNPFFFNKTLNTWYKIKKFNKSSEQLTLLNRPWGFLQFAKKPFSQQYALSMFLYNNRIQITFLQTFN